MDAEEKINVQGLVVKECGKYFRPLSPKGMPLHEVLTMVADMRNEARRLFGWADDLQAAVERRPSNG